MSNAEDDIVFHEVKESRGSSLVWIVVAAGIALILLSLTRRWLR